MSLWSLVYGSNRLDDYPLVPGTVIVLLVLCMTLPGCQSSDNSDSNIRLDWEIQPDPPSVGMAKINISLTDTTGQSVTGAEVELEGNMSHPGMKPVLTTAEEVAPGEYSATIEFTMGGDWFVLVESTLPDKRVIEREIRIPGVRSQ